MTAFSLQDICAEKLWLAPLAGFTDRAFRQLCKENGADVLVSEMVSADGLSRDSLRTIQYAHFEEVERPFGIQIFGSEPSVMAKAAEYCLDFQPDFIDINMGCPVRKVVKRGAGSALMRELPKAREIVSEVKSALGGSCFLGVKFRSGWSLEELNYIEFGKMVEEAGADFICLHARTQSQMFSGQADWAHIAALKKEVSLPLIGNGDVKTPEDVGRMMAETGCDSVMIGRGALGKPWIFSQSKQLWESGDYNPITKNQLLETIFRQIELSLKFKPERVVYKELRSQLCHYTKGLIGSAELRRAINQAESTEQIKELIRESETFRLL